MTVRLMKLSDLATTADIHKFAFNRQFQSYKWLQSYLQAFPHHFFFVIEFPIILGYFIWTQKSGFRREVVLEHEQIAILECEQGKGNAKQLILQSLDSVKSLLSCEGRHVKHVLVTTGADNKVSNNIRSRTGSNTF